LKGKEVKKNWVVYKSPLERGSALKFGNNPLIPKGRKFIKGRKKFPLQKLRKFKKKGLF